MPAPATSDAFLELVGKSGLLAPQRLQAYLDGQKARGGLPDAQRLAARMARDGLLTPFQAGQILKGRYRNFTVGKYRLLEPLGTGGMSKVFLCEHMAMGHRVAMKVLPLGPEADPSLVGRFRREARAVAALNHPNVVRAHDIDQEGNRLLYIIMDYVEGVNLHALVRKRGPLDATHVAHYIAQAAEGLQHIHEAGLIHRDIKPGNLLVDTTGTVKILDLGLARFLHDAGDAITKKFDGRAILGTADFMSPEQALKSHNADIRSDIYGLGATAYFLLTGRAPFEDEQNIAKKLLAHQMRAPEPIAALRGDVPAGLIAAVDRMMAKPREDRFQEPFEVADALAEWTQTPIPPPAADDIPRRAGSSSQASTAPGGRTSRNSSSSSRSMARRSARNDTPIPSALPPAPPQGTSKSIPRIAKSVKLVLGKLTTDRRRRTLIAAAVTLLLTGAGGLLVWRPWAAGSSVPPPAQSAPNNGGAAAK